jgi:VanZ family protein
MPRRLWAWGPAIALMAVIFYLSSRPAPEFLSTNKIDFEDKLLHVCAYWVLGGLCLRGFLWNDRIPLRTALLGAACLSALYGVSDEIHQAFVPERSSEFLDWAADAIGAAMLFPTHKVLVRLIALEKRVSRSLDRHSRESGNPESP